MECGGMQVISKLGLMVRTCDPQLWETEAEESYSVRSPLRKKKPVNRSTNESIKFHLNVSIRFWLISVPDVIVFLSCFPPYSFKKSLSLDLELIDWLNWLTSDPWGPPCFLAPRLGLYMCTTMAGSNEGVRNPISVGPRDYATVPGLKLYIS